jgi:hypothetical protein
MAMLLMLQVSSSRVWVWLIRSLIPLGSFPFQHNFCPKLSGSAWMASIVSHVHRRQPSQSRVASRSDVTRQCSPLVHHRLIIFCYSLFSPTTKYGWYVATCPELEALKDASGVHRGFEGQVSWVCSRAPLGWTMWGPATYWDILILQGIPTHSNFYVFFKNPQHRTAVCYTRQMICIRRRRSRVQSAKCTLGVNYIKP